MILSKQSCLWIWCLKWNRQLKRACHSTLMRFAGLEEAEEHWQGSCFTTIWSHFLRRLNAGSLWSTSQVLLQLAQIFWEIGGRQTFTNLLSICIFYLSLHFTTCISLGELGKSRRCAIQDDYASTHCGARAWWCKLQEAEAKIQGQLVLDFFGICLHQFINIQKLHCQSTCQFLGYSWLTCTEGFCILRTIPHFAGCSLES